MTDSVLRKVVVKHNKLCEGTLDNAFIDKSKCSEILGKLTDVELRSLSKHEFQNEVIKLIKFDCQDVESHGTIYFVEVNGVKKPAVYDLLCEMLLHINPEVMSKLFHEITNGYYKTVLSRRGLTELQFRRQVMLFLPYAKLDRLFQCALDDILNAALEVEECILYPQLSREDCYIVLRNIYKSTEPTLICFEMMPALQLPGNLGRYYRIKLCVDNNGKTEKHHLFAKQIEPDALAIPGLARISFDKECSFFGTIMKNIEQLGLEKLTDFHPKCYFTSNDMLIFDDVSIEGYKSWDIYTPVTYNWLVTTVKALAKLHATSIAFEEKLSEKLGKPFRINEEYPDAVFEAMFLENEDHEEIRDRIPRSLYEYTLFMFPHLLNIVNKDSFTAAVKCGYNNLYEVLHESNTIRNVLSHGDMWGANIMSKEDPDSKTLSAYLIDFQLTRYCAPSLDLLFLLYINTDGPTRQKHMTDLIELYYQELTQMLSSHDIDIGNIFTFSQLLKSCKEVEAAIVCKSLAYSQYLLMPKQYREEMMSDKERANKFMHGDRVAELEKVWDYEPLRKRTEWLMEDLVRITENESAKH